MSTRPTGAIPALLLVLLAAALTRPAAPAQAGSLAGVGAARRWVRLEANLSVDRPADLRPTLAAAHDAGANGVILADPKISLWPGFDAGDRRRWLRRARAVRDAAHALDMQLLLSTDPVGYCSSLLSYDVNLAAGIPVRSAPLVVRGHALAPVQTAELPNGSFERHHGDTVAGWRYQDEPGTATVVDTSVAHGGGASLKLPATGGDTRVFGSVRVKPFQQYLLTFWVRADNLTADWLGPHVGSMNGRVTLTDQLWSRHGREGTYLPSALHLSMGWTQLRMSFNSRELNRVDLGLGAWGHEGGTLWVDDVRVEAAPTLNLIRRPDLPVTVVDASGRRLREGADVGRVRDPRLGRIGWTGNYDTYHRVPRIRVPAGSRLRPGDVVRLSGQAATVTMAGQVACSWNHPRVLDLVRRIHEANVRALHPDAIMLDVDEVRGGGWDPQDERFPTSAQALGHHVVRVIRDLHRIAPSLPVYSWGDMFDPTMNAVRHYYQVRGSLAGSWRALRPGMLTIITWNSGRDLRAEGARSVKHWADLGFRQIVAGFYDEPVAANHDAWVAAVGDSPRVIGSLYTTWEDDYTALPEFGSLWWPVTTR